MKKLVINLVAGLFMLGMAGMANATLINFEGNPTGYLNGNEYASLGVLFSSVGGIGVQEVNYGGQITEVITSNSWYNPLNISFVNPTNSNENWTVTSVSMVNHFAEDFWTVSAYDLFGKLLDTQTVNYEEKTILFSGVGNIHSIVLDARQTAFAMDDLNYAGLAPSNPVPEPSTVLLLGAGIAGLAVTRLRRKNS